MNKESFKSIAKEVAKERKSKSFVTPELVASSFEVDITSILASNLGNTRALADNGEIIRDL